MPMSFGSVAKKVVATNIVAADGSGDFTDIQTAINALPVSGGVVYVKEGTYTITETIEINKDNVALVGAGKATKILTDLDIEIIEINYQSGVHIEKIYLYGAGAGSSNEALEIQYSSNSRIVDCWIENCGARAVYLNGSTDVKINGCSIIDNKVQGIYINAGTGLLVSNNAITGNLNDGVYLYGADELTIINNDISGNSTKGISSNENQEIIIMGNQIRDNGTSGIKFVNVDYSNVQSNEVNDNNTSSAASNGGVYLDADSDNNIILGNVVTGNNTWNIQNLGTGNIVEHNQ